MGRLEGCGVGGIFPYRGRDLHGFLCPWAPRIRSGAPDEKIRRHSLRFSYNEGGPL